MRISRIAFAIGIPLFCLSALAAVPAASSSSPAASAVTLVPSAPVAAPKPAVAGPEPVAAPGAGKPLSAKPEPVDTPKTRAPRKVVLGPEVPVRIFGFTKSYGYASKEIPSECYGRGGRDISLDKDTMVAITRIRSCQSVYGRRTNEYVEFLTENGTLLNLPIDEVWIGDDRLAMLRGFSDEEATAYRLRAYNFTMATYLNKINSALKAIEKTRAAGLTVLDWNIFQPEYGSSTGFWIRVHNPTKKTIKYITFNLIGYNAVKDPVKLGKRAIVTRKGIGPIEPGRDGEYRFEYAWFTDLVDTAKISSIKVQYMDGSIKTISNMRKVLLSEEHLKTINGAQ